jgi:hypothetical protein
MFVLLPGWAWLLLVWCGMSVLVGAGLARWFRVLRDNPR